MLQVTEQRFPAAQERPAEEQVGGAHGAAVDAALEEAHGRAG